MLILLRVTHTTYLVLKNICLYKSERDLQQRLVEIFFNIFIFIRRKFRALALCSFFGHY